MLVFLNLKHLDKHDCMDLGTVNQKLEIIHEQPLHANIHRLRLVHDLF